MILPSKYKGRYTSGTVFDRHRSSTDGCGALKEQRSTMTKLVQLAIFFCGASILLSLGCARTPQEEPWALHRFQNTKVTFRLPIPDTGEELQLSGNNYKHSGKLMGFYAAYVVLEDAKQGQDLETIKGLVPIGFPGGAAKLSEYTKTGNIQGYPYFEVAVNQTVVNIKVKFIRRVLLVDNQLFAFEISGPRYRENADSKEFMATARRFFDSIAIQ